MRHYRLPLKFIGLWVVNLVILLAIGIGLGLNEVLSAYFHNIQNLAYLYLFVSAILSLLEQELWDKIRGE